jgi:tRNA(Ile)-lysidine synthase
MPSPGGSRAITRARARRAAAIDTGPAHDLSAAAQRFAADWCALPPPIGRIGLAVSGGPDSLALMVLAHAAMAGCFEVATVDHGLRAEAAGEAAMVAQLCVRLGIEHRTIRLDLAGETAVQERARNARYAALATWLRERGLAALVTGHHADDQAETLVMRLNRGAGVRGLAGMRPRATVPGDPALPLLRPLLGWRRAELQAVIDQAGLSACADPSNHDPRFERVRVRTGLAGADWIDPAALAGSARHLVDADAAIDWAATIEWRAVEWTAVGCAYAPIAPRAVRLRVLEQIVARLGDSKPRGRELGRWLDTLQSGGVATLGGVRGDGTLLPWRFSPAPPRRKPATAPA